MATIWRDLLGAEVRFYDAGGVRTRSIAAGKSGEAVLFLHGIGATAETFSRNIVPFSASFRAHVIDLLGHGMTATIDGPLSREAFLKHILDYMDAAGIARAHLVGNSLGGWLAMWMAILHPERVLKVVNVVGAHLTVPVDEAAQRQAREGTERLKRLSKALADEPNRENMRARLGYVVYDPQQITDELVDVRWAMHQRMTNAAQIAAVVGNQPPENLLTPERLETLQQPAMLLWTDHNPSTAASAAQKAATYLPNGRFEMMTGCGHWPHWEDPPEFNRLVMEFLRA